MSAAAEALRGLERELETLLALLGDTAAPAEAFDASARRCAEQMERVRRAPDASGAPAQRAARLTALAWHAARGAARADTARAAVASALRAGLRRESTGARCDLQG